ncbi:Type IIS restriction enzyme Eco57I [Elizabethkingia anophelis]|uniref:site-specific DNA-methyltransferase (adenine-specific) n=1 Tax=Elizabethkingia anophelis TaxID=1117645 RepID=A0A7Z7LZX9_9FLAO|nr:Eco57I restriction-modification methylase domain-containing protein [Elizabethkingia anophelis]STF08846.1 Type IIS restriction enzyme Eco57I [Elizabethkingia anophelis]
MQTLPNIDINIKCGNSLISKFALNDSLKNAFKSKEITFSVEDYKQAVKDYKTTNSKTKKREIEDIISTIKNNLKSSLDNKEKEKVSKALGEYQNEEQRQNNLIAFGERIKKAEKDKLKKLKQKAEEAKKQKEEILNNIIYRNAFEWRFEFPEVLDNEGNFTGFDVIIGNPPYIQLQKMGEASDALQKLGYETFVRTGDIYSLFYELGYKLLKEKGLLTFITSNKWMRAAYGESLRKFFTDKTNPEILIDFGGTQIFDTATVDTNILMFSRDKNRQQTLACIVKEKELKNLSDYFRQNNENVSFVSFESWVILSEIEQSIKAKIETVGVPLSSWDINIYRGILTGYNDAFIIDGKKKDELIAEDPKSAEIIRPILRGRDIKKYYYNFEDLWLINVHNGIKEKGINPINIEDFKAVKKHLDKFLPILEKRLDKGNTPYNLRNCAYMEDFFRPKIIYPNMTKFLPFIYDDEEFVTNQKCFIITGLNIEFLTAFLNSSVFKYCFRDKFPELQGGTRELSKIFFDKIPVINVSESINNQFKDIVSNIQKFRRLGKETKDLELKIDNLIFDLYDLTKFEREEIGFIEIQ